MDGAGLSSTGPQPEGQWDFFRAEEAEEQGWPCPIRRAPACFMPLLARERGVGRPSPPTRGAVPMTWTRSPRVAQSALANGDDRLDAGGCDQ